MNCGEAYYQTLLKQSRVSESSPYSSNWHCLFCRVVYIQRLAVQSISCKRSVQHYHSSGKDPKTQRPSKITITLFLWFLSKILSTSNMIWHGCHPLATIYILLKSAAKFSNINQQESYLRGKVIIGVPAQSTSTPVVCPLQRGVSRQTSASWPLLTCSSLGATGLNTTRDASIPFYSKQQ